MRYLFALSLLVSFQALSLQNIRLEMGEEEECSALLETLKTLTVQAVDVPPEHEAGKPLIGRLHLRKDFTVLSSEWDASYPSLLLSSIGGPYPFRTRADVKELALFLSSDESEILIPFSIDIGSNVGGKFKFSWSIHFLGLPIGQGASCAVRGTFENPIRIHSDSVNMIPPLLRSLTLDKATYRPGDTAKATFRLSSPLKNLETDHFDFGAAGNKWVPDYGPRYAFVLNADQSYSVSFEIPESAEPGTYLLANFNREDAYGNYESVVGGRDAEEKRISEACPLIIEDAQNAKTEL